MKTVQGKILSFLSSQTRRFFIKSTEGLSQIEFIVIINLMKKSDIAFERAWVRTFSQIWIRRRAFESPRRVMFYRYTLCVQLLFLYIYLRQPKDYTKDLCRTNVPTLRSPADDDRERETTQRRNLTNGGNTPSRRNDN